MGHSYSPVPSPARVEVLLDLESSLRAKDREINLVKDEVSALREKLATSKFMILFRRASGFPTCVRRGVYTKADHVIAPAIVSKLLVGYEELCAASFSEEEE